MGYSYPEMGVTHGLQLAHVRLVHWVVALTKMIILLPHHATQMVALLCHAVASTSSTWIKSIMRCAGRLKR